MSWVLDVITVSMMRSRLALSDDPVSVTSTMASARTGGLTSVAPQENSTFTRTFRRVKYASVACTSSVAMVHPSRSAGVRNRESSGTASTQRTRPKLCFAYTRSATGTTSTGRPDASRDAACSAIQSCPVRPASRTPSDT